MKRTVWIFGLIAGAVNMVWLTVIALSGGSCDLEYGELIGYTSMILAFSLTFVAIRQFRERYNKGVITFGKAFLIGLYITLIASTIYVATWMIDLHFFVPDFGDQWLQHMTDSMCADGKTEQEIQAFLAEKQPMMNFYKTVPGKILVTYMEILPVGVLVSLISALILKKKPTVTPAA